MQFIQEKFSDLIQKINLTITGKLVEKLFEKHVLLLEEMNCVLVEKTSQTAARMLIIMIIQKGEESCKGFLQLLKTYDESLFWDVYGTKKKNLKVQQKWKQKVIKMFCQA